MCDQRVGRCRHLRTPPQPRNNLVPQPPPRPCSSPSPTKAPSKASLHSGGSPHSFLQGTPHNWPMVSRATCCRKRLGPCAFNALLAAHIKHFRHRLLRRASTYERLSPTVDQFTGPARCTRFRHLCRRRSAPSRRCATTAERLVAAKQLIRVIGHRAQRSNTQDGLAGQLLDKR
jgi:hypothetical protein